MSLGLTRTNFQPWLKSKLLTPSSPKLGALEAETGTACAMADTLFSGGMPAANVHTMTAANIPAAILLDNFAFILYLTFYFFGTGPRSLLAGLP
jgi:hypothetical protein